nr:hypothetical protein [Tanacetum cinerariifolium]
MSSVRTPQQNGVVERRNQTLVEAARTMLIFSRAPLFLRAEAIATTCFTKNRSIIHRQFNKTPYELINSRKLDISFLHVFEALCYPKNDHEDIGKLGAKETMNVSFDELSAMAFEQCSSKPGLQSELDLLFEAMYDDYIGGQPSATVRTILAAQTPQDHPLEQVIGEPSRPVLTWNQLRFDGDMCMYALTRSTHFYWLSHFEIVDIEKVAVHSGLRVPNNKYADYAGCKDTFKSTSGGARFLGKKLLTDYGFSFNKIPIYCDSKSAIAISCNPIQHSRIKHIIVRYHFIKEHVEQGTIKLYFVKTDYQLADLFTKALPAYRFNYLVRRLGMRSLSPQELDCLAKSQ